MLVQSHGSEGFPIKCQELFENFPPHHHHFIIPGLFIFNGNIFLRSYREWGILGEVFMHDVLIIQLKFITNYYCCFIRIV